VEQMLYPYINIDCRPIGPEFQELPEADPVLPTSNALPV
jgi:hypothetical protein